MEGPSGPSSSTTIGDPDDDDSLLANSEFLTRQELLKRRARRLRRLAKCYRDHYWSLMEDVRRKHREFYWKYGKSPYWEEEDYEIDERQNGVVNVNNNNHNHNNTNTSNNLHSSVNNGDNNVGRSEKLGLGFRGSFVRCSYPRCEAKAMALTRYCAQHIVSDTKQMLYKTCRYSLKRTSSDNGRLGPLLCGRTILRSITPSLCEQHALATKKQISQALKKGGASVGLSTKLACKFHLVINEYVHLIQSRRRAVSSRKKDNIAAANGGT